MRRKYYLKAQLKPDSVYRYLILASFIVASLLALNPQQAVKAAASLSITPITWNVIGLDSNNVNEGPNKFPVGARVCNTGDAPATNVTSIFVWDSADPHIDLRSGSLSSFSGANAIPSLGAGECVDFYYEVEVTRNSAAYTHTRSYHITATADGLGTVSTPTPRELYVEFLISQNRNAITDVELDGVSIPAGGSMALVVGNTYTIKLYGGTATQGYNQFEQFINFPNTIFKILSVETSYSANNSPYVPNPDDKLYADACQWENDPNSPNYRDCVGGDFKAGGSNVVTTYEIEILSGGGTTQTLNTLLYDFSGSSYHYNADFNTGARIAYIVDPANATISKSFSPNPTNVTGISALTITINNPNAATISGYNFTDPLPADMSVANPPNATTSGCGSPTFAPSAGATTLSFSNGTLAANSSCVIKVNVTTTSTGVFSNTTGNLFVNTVDTGQSATADLTVDDSPPPGTGICDVTMAEWTFIGFTVDPPPFPAANTQASDVSTASISVGGTNPGSLVAEADATGNPTPSIRLYGWPKDGPIDAATFPFIQFAIDTSSYNSIMMQFDGERKANGPNSDELYYSTDGSTWTLFSAFTSTTSYQTFGPYDFTGLTNTTGVTYFRIYGYGANATSSGNDLNLDNVLFSGCGAPQHPTISKSFSPDPVAVNGTSTLIFTLSNPNSTALTGATFTDTLPAGLEVAGTPNASTTCTGSPTWAPVAGAASLTFGDPTGGTIPASGSCTASVDVTATTGGPHNNVSGFLSTTEGGINTDSVASDVLTAVLPPEISKLFSPNPIIENGISTLTFTINNPNQDDGLNGVAFNDSFPAGMAVAVTPNASTLNCGTPTFSPAGGATLISFSDGTVAAGGTCTVTVDVTASPTGDFDNTSGQVSHTINTATVNGNTANDTLTVNAPNPAIALLKQVSDSASGPWTSFIAVEAGNDVYYQFTVENIGDGPLNPVSLTDDTLDVSSCNTTWTTLTLAVASADNDNHIATCVVGPVSTTSGTHQNTAFATGTYNSTTYNSANSTATYATTGLTIVKSATQSYFTGASETLNYSFTVTNSGAATLSGPVTVVDDKASDESCPALSTIGDNDNFFDPGETIVCSASYTTQASDVTAGQVTNVAFASAGDAQSETDSETVPLAPDLTAVKINDASDEVAFGDDFIWTVTVSNGANAGSASFADTDVLLRDHLPDIGATYSLGTVTTSGGVTGTINCAISTNVLTCTANGAVVMPAGSSLSVPVTVSATSSGTLTNPRSGGVCSADPDVALTEIDESNNDCPANSVDVVAIDAVDDTGSSVDGSTGGTSVASVLTNDTLNGAQATTSNVTISPVGVLPAGINLNTSTGEVTVDPGTTAGNYQFDYEICSIANPTVCDTATVNVPVTSGVNSGIDAAKTFSPDSAVNGDTVTVTITIENTGGDALTAVQATDDLSANFGTAGVDYTVSNHSASFTTGTGTATANSSFNGDSDQDLFTAVNGFDPDEVVEISFDLTFINVTEGDFTNTAAASGSGALSGQNVNDNATDSIALSFNVGLSKILDTASDELSNTVDPNVAIGEILTYVVELSIGPDLSIPGAALVDVLDTGLAFYDCVSVSAGADISTSLSGGLDDICDRTADFPPTANGTNPTVEAEPTSSGDAEDAGRRLTFDLGTISNGNSSSAQTLTITYRVIVLNTAANVRGVTLNNAVAWMTDDGSPGAGATEVIVVEPTLDILKAADVPSAAPGDVITFTIEVSHTADSDADAFDVIMRDTLPPELLYVTSSLQHVSGPAPSDLEDTNPLEMVVTWDTLPDSGVPSVIEFQATVVSMPAGEITNTATVEWSSFPLAIEDRTDPVSPYNTFSTERYYDPGDPVNIYGGIDSSAVITLSGAAGSGGDGSTAPTGLDLPDVGFPPGRITALNAQPEELAYSDLGGLWLEIPRLGIQTPIVGVPLTAEGWDLSWLTDQAGYLNGTAYPTWSGNTVIAGHVVTADGLPGPFSDLSSLRYGDTILIHAFGQRYVYELRANHIVRPYDLSVLGHEEYDWLTLLTCSNYNPYTGEYSYRTVIKAVLIEIQSE